MVVRTSQATPLASTRRRLSQARWPLAGREQPDDRVELVGQRHGGPCRRGLAELLARRRHRGVDADGQVVVVDRLPHQRRLAVFAGVDAPDDPLQLGELAHHVGDEVGLGEQAGPFGVETTSRASCVRLFEKSL